MKNPLRIEDLVAAVEQKAVELKEFEPSHEFLWVLEDPLDEKVFNSFMGRFGRKKCSKTEKYSGRGLVFFWSKFLQALEAEVMKSKIEGNRENRRVARAQELVAA